MDMVDLSLIHHPSWSPFELCSLDRWRIKHCIHQLLWYLVVRNSWEFVGIRERRDGVTESVNMFAFPKDSVEYTASIWPIASSFRPTYAEILELRYTAISPSQMLHRKRDPTLLIRPELCLADVSIFRLHESLAELWSTNTLPYGVKVIDLNTDTMVVAEEDEKYYALPADVNKKVDGKKVLGEGGNTELGELDIIGFGHFSRICSRQLIHEVLYYGKSLQPFVAGDSGTPLIQSGVRTLHSFFKVFFLTSSCLLRWK